MNYGEENTRLAKSSLTELSGQALSSAGQMVKRRPGIEEALAKLNEGMLSLRDSVHILREKLQPVSLSAPPSNPTPGVKAHDRPRCDIAGIIEDLSDRAWTLQELVKDAENRLDF